MKRKKVAIVGAGIVGLATAYQLLKIEANLDVVVVEKESSIAQHQTGRNSGVIHSGIYYKPGSLKAVNCKRGKLELLEFCQKFSIPTKKIGKVIVATEKRQIPALEEIYQRGLANQITIKKIFSEELQEIEPYVIGEKAIHIPDCSIVSFEQVAHKIALEFQDMGGLIKLGQEIHEIKNRENQIICSSAKDEFSADLLINCAGLFSDKIAMKSMGKIEYRIIPFKGEYYELSQESIGLIKGLIYPVPDPRFPFLGVHFTPRIEGKVEAGPNAILALSREGYQKRAFRFNDFMGTISYPGFWKIAQRYWKAGLYEVARSLSKKLFLRDLQKLVPRIQEKDLLSGGVGIRAQAVSKKGQLIDDFLVKEDQNMIHVLNAPSPAATASFAIGRQIAQMAKKKLEVR